MTSAAERYQAARQRAEDARRGSPLAGFEEQLRYPLDSFQRSACRALAQGRSVLVAAPTGAGKTTVAEFALHLAMHSAHPAKVFYTAPMKALSNQKFSEFQARYGTDAVGLLTGERNVNATARIVVMTTEVLRNMLYADSPLLAGLEYVVMDEVHYLADRFRGAVWEEVILHLRPEVRLVSLSATVSNAEEFGDWLQTVRGDTEVIVSEDRPVPLHQHALVQSALVELFDSRSAEPRVNPELVDRARVSGRAVRNTDRALARAGARSGRHGRRDNWRASRHDIKVSRTDVIGLLADAQLLPAIFFIFSRAGCDAAVNQVLRSGLRLTSTEEREEIRSVLDERLWALPDEDLGVLGYWDWSEALQRGVAAHHAGLLPLFKEVVEELFQRKLLKVVFATETLALGINMPARTVVLERLEKFNGEGRVPITSGEYTQLTGRAGRRGIDTEGHAVVQWYEGLDPNWVASLASRRSYPLNSSFRPSYNMAVNLIEQYGRGRTREILENSFAQFQADRATVTLARKALAAEESLAGYRQAMTCHLGDFSEYAAIRRQLTDIERTAAPASAHERQLRSTQLASLRQKLKVHPVHGCAEREAHARWAERWYKLRRDLDDLNRQIRGRTGSISRTFDQILALLERIGYLQSNDRLSNDGAVLRRIYGERDLLIAESLRRGLWNRLDMPSLAALISTLVYEPRREDRRAGERGLPVGEFRRALKATDELWAELSEWEREFRLPSSESLATGLASAIYDWARGEPLGDVLAAGDWAAGDFVRWCKQTIDVLDQLASVAELSLAQTARASVDALHRGVVAY